MTDITPYYFCYFFSYELVFYPRYHLDQSSLLCQRPLLGRPMVMDTYQDYILVTYRPFDVHVFHAQLLGELSPSNSPVLQVCTTPKHASFWFFWNSQFQFKPDFSLFLFLQSYWSIS